MIKPYILPIINLCCKRGKIEFDKFVTRNLAKSKRKEYNLEWGSPISSCKKVKIKFGVISEKDGYDSEIIFLIFEVHD